MKDTSGYGYKYADLPAIFEVINPLLKENGLGFYQAVHSTQDNLPFIQTVIFHIESGEIISSDTIIPQGVQLAKMNTYQVMGSAYTYYKRYALSAMLGLITDKDTDAQDVLAPLTQSAPRPQQKFTSPAAVASIHVCRDCGAPEVRNPKTNKLFCSKKCFVKKPAQPSLEQQYGQDYGDPNSAPPFQG